MLIAINLPEVPATVLIPTKSAFTVIILKLSAGISRKLVGDDADPSPSAALVLKVKFSTFELNCGTFFAISFDPS